VRAHRRPLTAALVCSLFMDVPAMAQDLPIDPARSRVAIRLFTTGAAARTFTIDAPIMDGSLGEPDAPHLQIAFDARRLRVLDHSALSPADRDAMQARMLGPGVLDVERFRWIGYHALATEPLGDRRWRIRGELSLHGQVHPLDVLVALENGRYTGSARVRQGTFGIATPAVMGGAVVVEDELEIAFDIVPED
jgi:polyisoprenoid-binding protein YceI